MSDVKQVKVDNWGIYFLQRLKHFFNRTDYCDLTLQFQDNAQLKVHRLVLNACTEYFELLERTCEMYEDCLVMPEDLQADVVVPIVNFMYTGQLEFRMDALERLYQTSQIMNMPVLSKLLEAHRGNHMKNSSQHNFGSMRKYIKGESSRQTKYSSPTPSSSGKRSYSKAFESPKPTSSNKNTEQRRVSSAKIVDKNSGEVVIYRDKKLHCPLNNPQEGAARVPSPIPLDTSLYNKRLVLGDPRPTRYELPEELDTDNIFDNSFTNISYTSQPLMVHPETTKQYSSKKGANAFNEPSSSKKSFKNIVDIVECKKISKTDDTIFEDDSSQNAQEDDMYQSAFLSVKDTSPKDLGQLFDQILDNNEGPKVTIEAKDKQASNLDHAKIISEVLKKYPHLVKSNKNIKLKILNTPAKGRKPRANTLPIEEIKSKPKQIKSEVSYTYETDVLDSKEAAKLISMGAENIKGPWICLICGTPGKALNFTSYYNFRRHLVDVHKEKPVSTICEHCGLKSYKRNYLLHHIYTKHGVPPPPQYHFPKCPMCNYIALTEGFLVKHKLTHSEIKAAHCIVCGQGFSSTNNLLLHIQKTGHKQQCVIGDKKPSIQCNYCMKVFLRDKNFYCHLKTAHKEQAIADGVLEDSDDERQPDERHEVVEDVKTIKHEKSGFENDFEEEIQYQIQKKQDGDMLVSKKPRITNLNSNQKILNTGYNAPAVMKQSQKTKIVPEINTEYIQLNSPNQSGDGNIVVINDVEYIMKDNQLIPRKSLMKQPANEEYILSDFIHHEENDPTLHTLETVAPTTSMDVTNMHSSEIVPQHKMILKKSTTLNQPIQIVVSNEEEYKALMASNHSIIFDDGDANKTLTVLTDPQNSSLDSTGIDLDNTQSNDMMIIQEDFPLNVSEAVTGDNSKYVVVYSHAMDQDDPTKQYQIITPQDIGAQYVQGSAVLTQNYNTITTSTSVVSANVLGTQIEHTWPQNVQHDVVDNQTAVLVAPENELQTIAESEQTNEKQNNDGNSMIALTETEILQMPSKSTLVQLEQIQECVNQTHEEHLETITTINPEQMIVEETQQNSIEEAMNIEIPAEEKEDSIVDETQIAAEHGVAETECRGNMTIESIAEETSEISLPEQEESEATLSVQEQPVVESSVDQEQTETLLSIEQPEIPVPPQNIAENIEESETITHETLNTEHDSMNIVEEMHQENNPIDEVLVQTESVKPQVVQTKEQIQNLTSEWSEDEYDTIMEEAGTNIDNVTGNKNLTTEEPELEESIENIQQEVQKEICDMGDSEHTTHVANFPSQNPDSSNLNEEKELQPNAVMINAEATQEKISSLLNDWEDNDSQEDNTSINENGDDNPVTTDSNENEATSEQNETIKTANVESKKDDNIKSLVSDWDDDEEENKE